MNYEMEYDRLNDLCFSAFDFHSGFSHLEHCIQKIEDLLSDQNSQHDVCCLVTNDFKFGFRVLLIMSHKRNIR